MDAPGRRDLIARIASDEAAFAELVARYQAAVRGYTALWAPSPAEADDIAQEVFLAALRGAGSYDPSRDLKSWLLGIARNLTRQAWRRMSRSGGRERLAEILEHHASAAYEHRARQGDRRGEALRGCIESLPEREKALFRRYVVDEESSAGLAREARTTEGTIRAAISRIRRRLRACIEGKLLPEAP